jgi:hypothetical protein
MDQETMKHCVQVKVKQYGKALETEKGTVTEAVRILEDVEHVSKIAYIMAIEAVADYVGLLSRNAYFKCLLETFNKE